MKKCLLIGLGMAMIVALGLKVQATEWQMNYGAASTNGIRDPAKINMQSSAPSAASTTSVMGTRSRLLERYAFTSNELARISPALVTEIQMAGALKQLWARAWPIPGDPYGRLLFVSMPNGVKYRVRNVEQFPHGYYVEVEWEGRHRESLKAPEPLNGFFRSWDALTLVVPTTGKDVLSLNKGAVITSSEWLVPWVVSNKPGQPRSDLTDRVFRSDSEFEAIVKAGVKLYY